MFTGLIGEMGKVVRMAAAPGMGKLTVEAPAIAPGAAVGDSVSVDGACLTVTAKSGADLTFDLSGETLSHTTLGSLRPGDRVNLEDALAAGDRMGGHYVLGHVDGVGKVVSVKRAAGSAHLEIRVPHGLAKYLVTKGSVAVDGVSLTVNEVRGDVFALTLVPHTLETVTLGEKRPGSDVNIECDILVKSVERLLGVPWAGKEGGGGRG